ncbi:hypothetical protein GCM10027343_09950 [Noviherbaspirillum agri]
MPGFITRNRLTTLVIGPTIWAAHFLGCYMIVSLACASGHTDVIHPGIGIITLAALALLGYAVLQNFRKWRQAQQAQQAHAPGADIAVFFSFNTVLLCALSAVALIWVAFPATLLPVCIA